MQNFQDNYNINVKAATPSDSKEGNTGETNTSENEGNSIYTLRFATNTSATAFDVEGEWKFKLGSNKNFLLGLGYNNTILTKALGYYYYGTAAYRFFLSREQKFPAYIWGSAGVSYTEFYDLGDKYTTPSNFLWEIGLDASINKKGTLGLTVYSTQFNNVWLGALINF